MARYNGRTRSEPIIVDGWKLANKAEWERYIYLRDEMKHGRITNLRCQVEFELMPTAREPDIIGKRGGVKKGKVIMYGCKYIADFVYERDGVLHVEDVKGFREDDYIVKRKWLYAKYGIIIEEV